MIIDYIHFDDWTAMYVDGKLAYQNHSINGVTAAQIIWERQGQNVATGEPVSPIISVTTHTPSDELE